MQTPKETLEKLVNCLIEEGEAVLKTAYGAHLGPVCVEKQSFHKFIAGCRTLSYLMEDTNPWHRILTPAHAQAFRDVVEKLLGTLKAVREALTNNWFCQMSGFVRAETFSDLLEQGEYLLSESYHVAGGVLGRAVLEGHLRSLCDKHSCLPTKQRPTINDFNAALYEKKQLDKVAMKHVEAMAAVGNHAAHNNPSLAKADVERLLRDVREFMVRNPL